MTSKIIILFILLIAGLYLAIPAEWKHVYALYNFSPSASKIIIPVSGLLKSDIEDTYGAFRSLDRSHEGLDLFAARGTEVLNCCSGHVLFIGRDVYGGNTIRILGEDNKIYYYAHLERYAEVTAGQSVSQGKVLGYVGNSGNAFATMPHLHFEIMEIDWLLPLIKKNVNPYKYLN